MENYTKKVKKPGVLYYYNSKDELHRLDGPAVEGPRKEKQWWVNDKRHREDGPAVEWDTGSKDWFINGLRHRIGAPAVEYYDGAKEWWVNGKKHRIDGPAYTDSNIKQWYIHNIHLTRFQHSCLNLFNVLEPLRCKI